MKGIETFVRAYLAHLKRIHRELVAWLLASAGGLQYLHDNFAQMQTFMPQAWYHRTMGALILLTILAHMLRIMRLQDQPGGST